VVDEEVKRAALAAEQGEAETHTERKQTTAALRTAKRTSGSKDYKKKTHWAARPYGKHILKSKRQEPKTAG